MAKAQLRYLRQLSALNRRGTYPTFYGLVDALNEKTVKGYAYLIVRKLIETELVTNWNPPGEPAELAITDYGTEEIQYWYTNWRLAE